MWNNLASMHADVQGPVKGTLAVIILCGHPRAPKLLICSDTRGMGNGIVDDEIEKIRQLTRKLAYVGVGRYAVTDSTGAIARKLPDVVEPFLSSVDPDHLQPALMPLAIRLYEQLIDGHTNDLVIGKCVLQLLLFNVEKGGRFFQHTIKLRAAQGTEGHTFAVQPEIQTTPLTQFRMVQVLGDLDGVNELLKGHDKRFDQLRSLPGVILYRSVSDGGAVPTLEQARIIGQDLIIATHEYLTVVDPSQVTVGHEMRSLVFDPVHGVEHHQ
jgi:hypothetical protein